MKSTGAGVHVDVDEKPREYEAPEWKVREILTGGGVTSIDTYLDALKEHLRSALLS